MQRREVQRDVLAGLPVPVTVPYSPLRRISNQEVKGSSDDLIKGVIWLTELSTKLLTTRKDCLLNYASRTAAPSDYSAL